jgi:lysophospholipase L1-like esterase
MNHNRRKFIKGVLAGGALATGFPAVGLGMSSAYRPGFVARKDPEDGKGFTFLFQGDSITDGGRGRNNDWNHVLGQDYAYLIASRLWYDHPSKDFHFFDRGISGNKVSDLAARWQQDTVDIKPDLLSILVGVNDLNSFFNKNDPAPVNAEAFETGYRALLQQAKEQLPAARVVVCEPFLLPVGKVKTDWAAWSTEMAIRQKITKQLAADTGALYIPLQDAFNEACRRAPADYWIWDGIHPMPAGHELIARRWIHLVGKELHFIR